MRRGKDEIGMVLLLGCRCRCGHEWLPRNAADKPRVCPKCKSPNWDRQKIKKGEPKPDDPAGP
jgi:predicted Zn-ribbon and HTH transcriptional regulator